MKMTGKGQKTRTFYKVAVLQCLRDSVGMREGAPRDHIRMSVGKVK